MPSRVAPLFFPDVLIHQSAVLLYMVGIVSSQVAAHVGAFPVTQLRLFEVVGLVAFISLACWIGSRDRFGNSGVAVLSIGGTLLIGVAVGLSGGSTSPLWVLYFLPAVFNGLYFGRRIAWAALAGIVVLSALPAMIGGDNRQLLLQLLVVAPIFIVVTEVAIRLVMGLQHAARVQVTMVEEQVHYAEAKRWSDQLEAISMVAQQLTRLTDVNAIAATIIDQTHRVVPFDSARVYVVEGTGLTPVAFQGTGDYAFETDDLLRVQIGEGITGWVALHAQPLIVDDASTDPRASVIPGTPAVEESMLLIPLAHDNEVSGVLVLVKLGRHQFSLSDLRLLMILAGQAANALAYAGHLTATRHRADTDGLTGLLNHRAIFEQLTLCLAHAHSEHQLLSVVMIDADDFKNVNDGFGHPSGDAVLQQVADVLRSVCRPHDLIARYGGDEFMLVLPGMAEAEANRIAGRIGDLAARRIVLRNDGANHAIALRLSAGVATFPIDGMTATELAATADARLYTDKAVSH